MSPRIVPMTQELSKMDKDRCEDTQYAPRFKV